MKIKLGDCLISSGDVTPEVRIVDEDGKLMITESSPSGATLGNNEKSREQDLDQAKDLIEKFEIEKLSIREFDKEIASQLGTKLGTPLSLSFLKYKSQNSNLGLILFLRESYAESPRTPKVISNLINGGNHAAGQLSFCEIMIIPQTGSLASNILASSQVLQDLRNILEEEYGESATLVGREGGFAPRIKDPKEVLRLLRRAINKRNEGDCGIAIDVAANNFSRNQEGNYQYFLIDDWVSTEELVEYYMELKSNFPELTYLEDPFDEDDISGWKSLSENISKDVSIVADDLTVTRLSELKKYNSIFDAVILKPNQIGDFTSLYEAYSYAKSNDISTVVSQRSGETDSDIISEISIGLGSEYVKIGPPARERIIKYNRLLRWTDSDKKCGET